MSRLDDALRQALRREDPGPEFTARVLARAAAQSEKKPWWQALAAAFGPGRMRWAAAGALACLLVVGGSVEYYHDQRVRSEGEAAKGQLMLALRIAGGKLNLARQRVQQLNQVPN